jgi:alpha-1,2-mannosyltransferase
MAGFWRRLLSGLRDGAGPERRRLLLFAGVLLTLELLGAAFLAAGTHGLIVPLDKPTTTDFVSFYAAGALADEGKPALAYDERAHYAAEQAAREPGIDYVHFFYPPIYLLVCALLARLPYLAGFAAFGLATLFPYLFVMRRILGERGWAIFVPILAFSPVLWTLGFGQNSLLTAALFGAATLLVDRRPILAGLFFGALCYKPHFGLLVPVALAAQKNWRAFGAAAFSALALTVLSTAVFGLAPWRGFVVAALGSHTAYEGGAVDHAAFVNPFGAVLVLGGSPALAYAVQGTAALLCAALVAVVWRRGASLPARAAVLAAATIVAIPVVLFYDLVLGAVAGAWLVRGGRENGFLPWRKLLLAMLYLVPLVARNVATAWHLPLGPLAALALLALAATAARREIAEPSGPQSARRSLPEFQVTSEETA